MQEAEESFIYISQIDVLHFYIKNIKIEAFLVPEHTWGHLVYLIDDTYLFTVNTIWFGADSGYAFFNRLAEYKASQ